MRVAADSAYIFEGDSKLFTDISIADARVERARENFVFPLSGNEALEPRVYLRRESETLRYLEGLAMMKRQFEPMGLKALALPLILSLFATVPIPAIAATSGWRVVPSPNETKSDYLYSVAASSSTDAWAVGAAYNRPTETQLTLVEHWNGKAWSIVPSPNPGTAEFCGFQSYAGNYLYGVTAVSGTEAWAVGEICPYGVGQTLAEHWDGTQWAVVASPSESGAENSTLAAVASISSNDVWAVGNYQEGGGAYQWNTLTEHWDGTQWSIVGSPNVAGADENFLTAIAAISSTDIWAVGHSETNITDVPLIEHYDGQGWSIVSSPYPPPSEFNELYAVAAISANDVWAVGYENENSSGQYGGALTEHWDGTSWSLVSAPDPGNAAELLGATTLNGSLWAVGAYSTSTGIDLSNAVTLVLQR